MTRDTSDIDVATKRIAAKTGIKKATDVARAQKKTACPDGNEYSRTVKRG
jgi:hypothetical protein